MAACVQCGTVIGVVSEPETDTSSLEIEVQALGEKLDEIIALLKPAKPKTSKPKTAAK